MTRRRRALLRGAARRPARRGVAPPAAGRAASARAARRDRVRERPRRHARALLAPPAAGPRAAPHLRQRGGGGARGLARRHARRLLDERPDRRRGGGERRDAHPHPRRRLEGRAAGLAARRPAPRRLRAAPRGRAGRAPPPRPRRRTGRWPATRSPSRARATTRARRASPDGAFVVFVREEHLMRVDLADGRVRRLTGGFKRERSPRFLPSGRIVCAWSEGKRHGIDAIDAEGKGRGAARGGRGLLPHDRPLAGRPLPRRDAHLGRRLPAPRRAPRGARRRRCASSTPRGARWPASRPRGGTRTTPPTGGVDARGAEV